MSDGITTSNLTFYCLSNPNTNVCEVLCSNNPNLWICSGIPSYYYYRLDIVANATFLAVFSISLIAYLATYIATRRGLGFTIAMAFGLIAEILGYSARIMSWENQWSETPFFMQICCLAFGPAFMAAGVYLCLRRIVFTFGPENSRISPQWYTRTFIPCDVVSLLLQAAGGGIASVAWKDNTSIVPGDNIMIAGLSFQVFTLLIFMICSVEFSIHTMSRYRKLGDEAFSQNASVVVIRGSRMFKGFVAALSLATICIFWRSVYRIAELSDGWSGPLMYKQGLFIGFEGVLIAVACVVLNIFHPSVCFKEMMEGDGGLWTSKEKKKTTNNSEKENSNAANIQKAGKEEGGTFLLPRNGPVVQLLGC